MCAYVRLGFQVGIAAPRGDKAGAFTLKLKLLKVSLNKFDKLKIWCGKLDGDAVTPSAKRRFHSPHLTGRGIELGPADLENDLDRISHGRLQRRIHKNTTL